MVQAGKLAKKKDQENAERERARQEAQMAKAAKRARDAESKSARAAKTPARDAAAGANGAEPPAKRCAPLLRGITPPPTLFLGQRWHDLPPVCLALSAESTPCSSNAPPCVLRQSRRWALVVEGL